MSSFFSLNRSDFVKGLIVAVVGAVLAGLQQGLTDHGVDLMAYDWKFILDVAGSAALSYLGKNLFTTADGRFMGVVKV